MAFAAALESHKITVSTRQTRGLDASAACGQLRNKFQKSPLLLDSEDLQSQPDIAVACWSHIVSSLFVPPPILLYTVHFHVLFPQSIWSLMKVVLHVVRRLVGIFPSPICGKNVWCFARWWVSCRWQNLPYVTMRCWGRTVCGWLQSHK